MSNSEESEDSELTDLDALRCNLASTGSVFLITNDNKAYKPINRNSLQLSDES